MIGCTLSLIETVKPVVHCFNSKGKIKMYFALANFVLHSASNSAVSAPGINSDASGLELRQFVIKLHQELKRKLL